MNFSINFNRKQLSRLNAQLVGMIAITLVAFTVEMAFCTRLLHDFNAKASQQLQELKAFNANIHAQIDECIKNPMTCRTEPESTSGTGGGLTLILAKTQPEKEKKSKSKTMAQPNLAVAASQSPN